jgi:hypothetical protein
VLHRLLIVSRFSPYFPCSLRLKVVRFYCFITLWTVISNLISGLTVNFLPSGDQVSICLGRLLSSTHVHIISTCPFFPFFCNYFLTLSWWEGLGASDSPASCARVSVTTGRTSRRGEATLRTNLPALRVIGSFRWAGNPSSKKKTESLCTSADVPVRNNWNRNWQSKEYKSVKQLWEYKIQKRMVSSWSKICLCLPEFQSIFSTYQFCREMATLSKISMYSRIPLSRKLVIRIPNYPNRLGSSGKHVDNSTKLTCLEITGYRIKYSTALWLLELQIRCGRKV